jgi:hypothetical protein
MSVTKRTRFEVLRRDNHTCRYCRATDAPLTVDHVTPVALGGSDSPDNLVAACRDCNAGKSSAAPDATLVSNVAEDAVRWRIAMQQAAAWSTASLEGDEKYTTQFTDIWWKYLPADHESSLLAMKRAGLPVADLLYAARVAQDARGVEDRWRYFCGVAWKRLQLLQEKAGDLIAASSPAVAANDETGPQWFDCTYCDRKVDIYREDFDTDEQYEREIARAHCFGCSEAYEAGQQLGYGIGLQSRLRVDA